MKLILDRAQVLRAILARFDGLGPDGQPKPDIEQVEIIFEQHKEPVTIYSRRPVENPSDGGAPAGV